jgi:hypothetical protein
MHSTLQDIELWHREEDSKKIYTASYTKKTIQKSLHLRVPPPLRHEIVSVCLFEAQLFARLFTSVDRPLRRFRV